MDLIQQFLDARGEDTIDELAAAGFSSDQAGRFIPQALASLIGGMQGHDLPGLLECNDAQQVSTLLGSVNIGGLAERLGIDNDMAGAGIGALIPQFLGFIKDNDGLATMVSMLGQGGMGGFGQFARGLFH